MASFGCEATKNSRRGLSLAILLACVFWAITNGLTSSRITAPLRLRRGLQLPDACTYFFGYRKWTERGRMNAYAAEATQLGGCVPHQYRFCTRTRLVMTHTWANKIDFNDETRTRKLMLFLYAWVITQDLSRSRFALWTDVNISATVPAWLASLSPHVGLEHFDYDREAASTPLALSRHFASWERLEHSTHGEFAAQSDIVRNILLHNYGGIWLDGDSVPLRDLWNITAGIGIQFMPKFEGSHANGHVMYAPCPHTPLSRRRLQLMAMFPWEHPEAWPRDSPTGQRTWPYNDALSEQVRAAQALEYNISNHAEEIDPRQLSDQRAWYDVEFGYPIAWFDPWWVQPSSTKINSREFARQTICGGALVWHRLNKHVKGSLTEFGPVSGCDELWAEILGMKDKWTEQPRRLTGGVTCE